MSLSGYKVGTAVAVTDVARAREFFEGKLGLVGEPMEDQGGIGYACGEGTGLFVYQSQYAGTNKATLAAFSVGDVEKVVDELTAKGVEFEHYDTEFKTDAKGIFTQDGMSVAWFKDPDGNIFALNN
jgi:catechol 2,3-dioxygenase-like lactoylglutathione lyase family enzyme